VDFADYLSKSLILSNAKNDRLAEEIVTLRFSGRGFYRSAAKALLDTHFIFIQKEKFLYHER
jgi:hypothetical protein